MSLFITRRTLRLTLAAALSLTAAAAYAAGAPEPYIAGTWQLTKAEPVLRTSEGKLPPLKPEAAKLYQQRIADRKAGKLKDVGDDCLPVGVPRLMLAPGPFILLQTGRQVTVVHEFNHSLRPIYMNEKLKPTADLDPTFLGTSAGHWEGDTLVVETGGFRGATWIDHSGLPKSDNMRVTERLRLIDKGATLENRITVVDPENYTAPWTARITYRKAPPGVTPKEDVCALKLPMAAHVKDITGNE